MEIALICESRPAYWELKKLLSNLKTIEAYNGRNIKGFAYNHPKKASTLENAKTIALDAYKQLSSPVLVEETILIIPGLGPDRTSYDIKLSDQYTTNVEKAKAILEMTRELENDERNITFESSLYFISEHEAFHSTATVEGYLSTETKGSNDHFLENIFIKHDYDKTLAQLPVNVRDRISYRFKAFEKLIPQLDRAVRRLLESV